MNIAYALETGGLAGGHKLVLEHLTRLTERGHVTKLFLLHHPDFDWFPGLKVSDIEVCISYRTMQRKLSMFPGPKVATWWKTAPVVAASGPQGFYFVQDIETGYAYLPNDAQQCMATYQLTLHKFTSSSWVEQQLMGLGLSSTWVGVGIDDRYFYPEENTPREGVIFHDRAHHLKGPQLRQSVVNLLRNQIPFTGYSPWVPTTSFADHLANPSDAQLGEHMRNSLCLLVTSSHEGFCLPAAEAMACGIPVVTTQADGNNFCIDGHNCLMGSTYEELGQQIMRLRDDPQLWLKLREGAIDTAKQWNWNSVMDRVEQCLTL